HREGHRGGGGRGGRRGGGGLVGEHRAPDDPVVVLEPRCAGDQGELGVAGGPQLGDPVGREHLRRGHLVVPGAAVAVLDQDGVADVELVDALVVGLAVGG